MQDEFDYDLTPGQWEALKALRTAASPLPRISRYTSTAWLRSASLP